jgi:hypothetical protein
VNIKAPWKSSLVKDFVDNCNWLGIPSSLLSEVAELSQSTTKLRVSLVLWKSIKTQVFFELNNWDGKSIYVDAVNQAIQKEQIRVLSFTLVNNQFWQCFNWSNQTHSSSETKVTESIKVEQVSAPKQFTLNDLSQLF